MTSPFSKNNSSQQEKLNAACSLNLLTISVSQIIDYQDRNILDMEYDAILNNLNLQNINHSEHLLKVFKQILDVITFYRIDEKERQFIEFEYQNRMKNAIWSAVPNFALILSTPNVGAMAVALATQVGVGYMNYRKEKSQTGLAKDKELWQLERSAIEQLNGLRRELFAAAWNIAKEYDFPDEWRLTEHQISDYNAILMEHDPIKRYQALNHIKDHFEAYPPFWYQFAHAAKEVYDNANYLFAHLDYFHQTTIECIKNDYKDIACQLYKRFYKSKKTGTKNPDLLREDIIYASCALEQIPLINDIKEKKNLLDEAQKHVGNNKDVLQLIALNQVAIGDYKMAQENFLYLVNCGYNIELNAQILGGIYEHESNENDYYLLKRNLSLTNLDFILKPYKEELMYDELIEDLKHDVNIFKQEFLKYIAEKLCRWIVDPHWTIPGNLLEIYTQETNLLKLEKDNEKKNHGFIKDEFLSRYLELTNNILQKFSNSNLFPDAFVSLNKSMLKLDKKASSSDFKSEDFIKETLHCCFTRKFIGNADLCVYNFEDMLNNLEKDIMKLPTKVDVDRTENPYKRIKDGLDYLYNVFYFSHQPYTKFSNNKISDLSPKQLTLPSINLVYRKNEDAIKSIIDGLKADLQKCCKVIDRENEEMCHICVAIATRERLLPYYAISIGNDEFLLLFDDHIVYFDKNKVMMHRYMVCAYKDIHYLYNNDKLIIDNMQAINGTRNDKLITIGCYIPYVNILVAGYTCYNIFSNVRIIGEQRHIIAKLLNKLRDSL